MTILFYFSTAWALVMLAVLVWAIRISYAIERKAGITDWHGLQRRTNLFASAFGSRGGNDPESVLMRARLRLLLAILVAGFLAFGAVFILAPGGAPN